MSSQWTTRLCAATAVIALTASCASPSPATFTPAPTPTAPAPTESPQPTPTDVPTQPTAIPGPTDAATQSLPAARGYSRLVFDERSDQVLLVGGFTKMAMNADLWDIWSLDPRTFTWRQDRQEDVFSMPYNYDCLALDAQSQKVIIYTIGWTDSGQATGVVETWAYDLATATWAQMAPATQPPPRWGSRMAYDSESDRIILFGGTDAVTLITLADTWAYDYESDIWTELQVSGSIPPHHFFDMAYVPDVDRVILFGGMTSSGEDQWTLLNDTWAFDYNGSAWVELQPKAAPSPRAYQTLVYDPISGDLIQYGGTTSYANYPAEPTTDETWRYSVVDNTWRQVATTTSPGKRAWHQAVGTPEGVVLFGGGAKRSDYQNDSWLFSPDAETWRRIP